MNPLNPFGARPRTHSRPSTRRLPRPKRRRRLAKIDDDIPNRFPLDTNELGLFERRVLQASQSSREPIEGETALSHLYVETLLRNPSTQNVCVKAPRASLISSGSMSHAPSKGVLCIFKILYFFVMSLW